MRIYIGLGISQVVISSGGGGGGGGGGTFSLDFSDANNSFYLGWF